MVAPAKAEVQRFREHGFVVVDTSVGRARVGELREEVDRLLEASRDRGGVRNVFSKSECLREFASQQPRGLARHFLTESVLPVKLTIFDKTPDANWTVPMHQDLTIAVKQRLEVPGFGPWSTKDGVVHVQPPTEVLESMIGIRLHLDETPEGGGALRVIPGSHRLGRLSTSEIRRVSQGQPARFCPVGVGGAMIMSPLLLHASTPAERPTHRRVLHFEFAATDLPGGLEWAQ